MCCNWKNFCPQHNTSCNLENGYYFTVPAWAGLVSSLLSVFSCVLMLISYHKYRDFRTGSRRVANWLAVSNLFLALGHVVGSLNFIVYGYAQHKSCLGFVIICQAQAFVAWSSALASFIWTGILSVYLFVTLVKKTINTANHWLTWMMYYVVSIAIPIVTMGVVTVLMHLGYSPYATGGTCFISTGVVDNKTNDTPRYGFTSANLSLILVIKGMEVASYLVVIFFFGVIQYKIVALPNAERSEEYSSSSPQTRRREWRLVAVPILFVSLRIWGTISMVVSIVLFYTGVVDQDTSCMSEQKAVYGVLFCLNLLQAIGDPGLGWGNSILFVFLSPKVRQRMFGSCLHVLSRFFYSTVTSPPSNIPPSYVPPSTMLDKSTDSASRTHNSVTDFESFVSSNLFLDHSPVSEDYPKTVDNKHGKKSGYNTFSTGSSVQTED